VVNLLAFGRAPDTKAWAVLVIGTALIYTGHAADVSMFLLVAAVFLGHDVADGRYGQPVGATQTLMVEPDKVSETTTTTG